MIRLNSVVAYFLMITIIGCTIPPKSNSKNQIAQNPKIIKIKAQDVVDTCVTPHEVYGFPAQPIPGIPLLLARHAECLGHPNIVIALWPGEHSKVNMLYVTMMVERFVEHLKKNNEHFDAKLITVNKVQVSKDPKEASDVPTFIAIYKLEHRVQTTLKK